MYNHVEKIEKDRDIGDEKQANQKGETNAVVPKCLGSGPFFIIYISLRHNVPH